MDSVQTLLDRPKLYYNIDGVGELGVGFLCVAYTLLGWMQVHSPEHSFWNRPYAVMVFLGATSAIIHLGSKAIKEHITYPRTGRVEYTKRDALWRPMIVAFVFSAAASAGLVMALRSHADFSSLTPLFGLVLAGSYARSYTKCARWKWVVVWGMAICSVTIALLPDAVIGAIADHSWINAHVSAKVVGAVWLSMLLYGAMLLISGGISFGVYLGSTESQSSEER